MFWKGSLEGRSMKLPSYRIQENTCVYRHVNTHTVIDTDTHSHRHTHTHALTHTQTHNEIISIELSAVYILIS